MVQDYPVQSGGGCGGPEARPDHEPVKVKGCVRAGGAFEWRDQFAPAPPPTSPGLWVAVSVAATHEGDSSLAQQAALDRLPDLIPSAWEHVQQGAFGSRLVSPFGYAAVWKWVESSGTLYHPPLPRQGVANDSFPVASPQFLSDKHRRMR